MIASLLDLAAQRLLRRGLFRSRSAQGSSYISLQMLSQPEGMRCETSCQIASSRPTASKPQFKLSIPLFSPPLLLLAPQRGDMDQIAFQTLVCAIPFDSPQPFQRRRLLARCPFELFDQPGTVLGPQFHAKARPGYGGIIILAVDQRRAERGENIDPGIGAGLGGIDRLIISKMEAATNFLNSIQVNDCRLGNRMVQIAKGDDNMSGIIEEMTGYRSVKQGFAKSYQQSRERIEANANNPTEDLRDALANCPAEVTEIFRTGSLLAHAAARVGAGSWAGVMRARVGDVYMRWDEADKVPLFSAIPACPAQDNQSADDFLTGKVQRRALNMPPTAEDCAIDGTGKGALELARTRLEAIAAKIRSKTALTAEERQFVANVRTLPVYRLLEWAVRQGVVASVIADTDELVALTLAYQMLNDLTRSIDYALSNAERGAGAAGAADGANSSICQTRILTKGLEQLRDLREEVLRQRAQMRQSYLTALGSANLSASYAGLLRQRDIDARNAAGAASTRNR